MKKLGIFLILAGILCVLAFILYTIALEPGIPLLIKFGVSTAIIGLIIVIGGLVLERFNKKKGGDNDDLSQY